MKYNKFIKWKTEKRGDKKVEEIKKVYNELTEGNKDVLNLVAKGMLIAQEEEKEKILKEGGTIKNDQVNN